MPVTRSAADPALADALRRVAPGGPDEGRLVRVLVSACVYSCCARTWTREGYEQPYEGKVLAVLAESFVLAAPGIGTWNFMISAALADLLDVEPL